MTHVTSVWSVGYGMTGISSAKNAVHSMTPMMDAKNAGTKCVRTARF